MVHGSNKIIYDLKKVLNFPEIYFYYLVKCKAGNMMKLKNGNQRRRYFNRVSHDIVLKCKLKSIGRCVGVAGYQETEIKKFSISVYMLSMHDAF